MKRFGLSVLIWVMVIHVCLLGTPSVQAQQNSQIVERGLENIDSSALASRAYGRCGEWHDLAIAIGWPESQWPKLSYVMYRESRCKPSAFNGKDPNGGSRGLMQINGYWCRKNKYNPQGWLQAQGILRDCNDLHDPQINLQAGLAMWNYSQKHNGCGWRPWATSCR